MLNKLIPAILITILLFSCSFIILYLATAETENNEKNILLQSIGKTIILNNDKVHIVSKQNDKFCHDDIQKVVCNKDINATDTIFTIISVDGKNIIQNEDVVYLINHRNNLYCAADRDDVVKCNQKLAGQGEKFIISNGTKIDLDKEGYEVKQNIKNYDDITLRTYGLARYCSTDIDYRDLKCNRDFPELYGKFYIYKQK